MIKSPPRNSPQRIDYSCSGGFFFAKKLPAGARTPEPMCSKMPITTSLGFREFINVPDVPQNFARLAIRRSRLSRKKQGVLSHRQLTTLSTPPFFIPYVLPEDGFNLDFRGFQHVRKRLPDESMTVRFQVGFDMNFRKKSMNFCNSVSFESRSTSQATTSLISQ